MIPQTAKTRVGLGVLFVLFRVVRAWIVFLRPNTNRRSTKPHEQNWGSPRCRTISALHKKRESLTRKCEDASSPLYRQRL